MTHGDTTMPNYPPGRVQAVWNKCKGRCWLCGEQVGFYGGVLPDAGTLDHVVPRARGGRSTLENLKLAHRKCNIARGAPHVPRKPKPQPSNQAALLAAAIRAASEPDQ
jgi:5-methylcytosine-specific restriction endonuclease McrA